MFSFATLTQLQLNMLNVGMKVKSQWNIFSSYCSGLCERSPESGAGSQISFCSSLNLGWWDPRARARIMLSLVVMYAPASFILCRDTSLKNISWKCKCRRTDRGPSFMGGGGGKSKVGGRWNFLRFREWMLKKIEKHRVGIKNLPTNLYHLYSPSNIP